MARRVLPWLSLLGGGAILLLGRYDFAEAGGVFAWQGYLSSLYFFLWVVPVAWGIGRALGGPRVGRGAAAAAFVVGALPYRWLGLGRFRHVTTITFFAAPGAPTPHLAWLPGGGAGAPGERWLLLALVIVVGAAALWRGRRRAALLVGALALIALEAGLHTSMRSPYTYVPHFEARGKWYHAYLLPDGAAAANADVNLFLSLDDHFNGLPKPVNPYLLRRSFTHYLASHFDYLVNPFYVYLILNCLLWLAAVSCLFGWARRVSGSTELALLAAALAACGNGFIYYVGQPMHYLAFYSSISISLYFFERLMVTEARWPATLLYGALLGLCACTYDFVPFYAMLLLYAWARGARLRHVVAAIGVALACYYGFLAVQYGLLHVPRTTTNQQYETAAAPAIARLLARHDAAELYDKSARFLVTVGQDFVYAFVVVGLVVGAIGLFAAERRLQLVCATVLAPALAVDGWLFFGDVRWGRVLFAQLPRFTYVAYPAIYLGAAIALVGAARLVGRRLPRLARALPWAFVAAVALFHNVDVLGLPDFNYHFYWPTPIECDPYARAGLSCAESPSGY